MADADFDHILTSARIHLPGVLDDAMKLEIVNVLNEFLGDSNVWRYTFNVSTVVDQLVYSLIPPQGRVNRLIGTRNESDRFVQATLEDPGYLILSSTGETAEVYHAEVGLTVEPAPQGSCDTFPDLPEWIVSKYSNTLIDGLLSRMMSQPAKPYTSERHAIYHMRRFRNGIAVARVESNRKNLYSGQAWTFPQSFAVNRQ